LSQPAQQRAKATAMRHAGTPESLAWDSPARNRGLPGKRRKAIRKQSAQSNLPEVCPFALYAFCMLSEHCFGKVVKRQQAHKSASLETSRKRYLLGKNGFFRGS
jgi:hypothetical protein